MIVDILIVEDDESTNAAMMKLLSRMGHRPRGACTFTAAMDEVNRCAPQVLITDWDLGELKSGIDVATTALALRANCKVVFCSGNSQSALRRNTQHLNICRYIRKPISMSQMRNEFKTVFDEL
ncbi:response regulator [Granulosicoccus antarcticus]|uniref:Response regulatory domain-containing protein n=1 Tax=Granulosicoccus antarcticus IMCC3135 TaxID=1192854 RepID=A0A2Z2P4D9_9GAMM|nr:response regulator [Granulosicoccus antarcticus]ASJ75537.1 hypothetical protein IMCC3135_27415 [Granulosicoccus antarcticus IMCC3135]